MLIHFFYFFPFAEYRSSPLAECFFVGIVSSLVRAPFSFLFLQCRNRQTKSSAEKIKLGFEAPRECCLALPRVPKIVLIYSPLEEHLTLNRI